MLWLFIHRCSYWIPRFRPSTQFFQSWAHTTKVELKIILMESNRKYLFISLFMDAFDNYLHICNRDVWFLCNCNFYFTGCLLLFLSNIQEQGWSCCPWTAEEGQWWWISWNAIIPFSCCFIWVIDYNVNQYLVHNSSFANYSVLVLCLFPAWFFIYFWNKQVLCSHWKMK